MWIEFGKELYITLLKVSGLSEEEAKKVYAKVIEEIDKGNVPAIKKWKIQNNFLPFFILTFH